MSAAAIIPTIPSRPTYGALEPRAGKAHLMIADAEGAEAILDLAAKAPADLMAKAHVFYFQIGRASCRERVYVLV